MVGKARLQAKTMKADKIKTIRSILFLVGKMFYVTLALLKIKENSMFVILAFEIEMFPL